MRRKLRGSPRNQKLEEWTGEGKGREGERKGNKFDSHNRAYM